MSRLTKEQFIMKAIVDLRKDGFKGIHAVYSGVNSAFKKYFNGDTSTSVTQEMEKDNLITIRPCKGGVMLYLFEDGPKIPDIGDEALRIMGLDKE